MFGDLFGQRDSYTEGMFYAGRRKYLKEKNEKLVLDDELLPPDIFKTPRQRRNINKNRAETTIPESSKNKNFMFSFQQRKTATDDENIESNTYLKKFKKQANTIQQKVIIQHYSSTEPSDWIVKKEAGVLLYINKETGEVSATCPWIEQQSVQQRLGTAIKSHNHHHHHHNQSNTNTDHHHHLLDDTGNEEELGTGSLAYDRREVEALFEALDHNDSSNNKNKK